MLDVPINAPTDVAVESANSARSMPSTSPFLLTLPVKFATEVSVPAVSKKSTNKKANAVPIKPAVAISEKSSEKACAGDGIDPTTPDMAFVGYWGDVHTVKLYYLEESEIIGALHDFSGVFQIVATTSWGS